MAAMLVAVAITAAGCSGFDKSKTAQGSAAVDTNIFPANYRTQIATFLSQSLTTRPDFRGALIAQPVLKPVGDNPHYVVCIQFSGSSQLKAKVAVYLAGQMNEFIDATPEQCSDAVYQPFKELEATLPPK